MDPFSRRLEVGGRREGGREGGREGVLQLRLWFSCQVVLLLGGDIVPVGWSVLPWRLRVGVEIYSCPRPFPTVFGDHNLPR